MRSFCREVIEFAADVEKPLGKASKFTTGVVIFELKAKQFQKVTGGGDGTADGGRVGAKRDGSLGEGELGNGVKLDGILASQAKFPLQVLLGDLYIAQGHADVFVSQQFHQSRKADTEAQHRGCVAVSQTMRVNRGGAIRATGSVG